MISLNDCLFPTPLDTPVTFLMEIEAITSAEAEARANALGKTDTPGSEEEFADFEGKYLGGQ